MHQGAPNQDFPPFLRPMPLRPPFFIREIYKNGFLKRLPYNERKSSALAKLMKSDRFWVVFSVHDDVHPFLELWHEPTEVASKPPQYIFPLLPFIPNSKPIFKAVEGSIEVCKPFESTKSTTKTDLSCVSQQ